MSYKKFTKQVGKGLVSLVSVSTFVSLVGVGDSASASTSISQGKYVTRSVTPSLRSSSLGSLRNTNYKYKLTTGDKVLGGITLGVGAISLVGTAVGLGLTESQYEQTKNTYNDVVNRNYDAFYEEKEKYMQSLFSQWNVPMPDKYKNPIKKEDTTTVTPGFSIGMGD